ncbi:hypothetical protein HDV00_005823 [Rhizophlyctis rosea]|nr:hypothetical protein HDV00_005823 [Rhizophlyctis rosea]
MDILLVRYTYRSGDCTPSLSATCTADAPNSARAIIITCQAYPATRVTGSSPRVPRWILLDTFAPPTSCNPSIQPKPSASQTPPATIGGNTQSYKSTMRSLSLFSGNNMCSDEAVEKGLS